MITIELLPFDISDAPELIANIENKRMLLQFAGPVYHFPLTVEQLEADKTDKNRTFFRISEKDNQKTIGHAQILLKEHTFLLGRILIWDENNRGKGYGKQTIRKLLEYGFTHFDRDRAELNVYDWNAGAIECYQKVGFEIDPNVMSEVFLDGERWLSLNMKIDIKNFELPIE